MIVTQNRDSHSVTFVRLFIIFSAIFDDILLLQTCCDSISILLLSDSQVNTGAIHVTDLSHLLWGYLLFYWPLLDFIMLKSCYFWCYLWWYFESSLGVYWTKLNWTLIKIRPLLTENDHFGTTFDDLRCALSVKFNTVTAWCHAEVLNRWFSHHSEMRSFYVLKYHL